MLSGPMDDIDEYRRILLSEPGDHQGGSNPGRPPRVGSADLT